MHNAKFTQKRGGCGDILLKSALRIAPHSLLYNWHYTHTIPADVFKCVSIFVFLGHQCFVLPVTKAKLGSTRSKSQTPTTKRKRGVATENRKFRRWLRNSKQNLRKLKKGLHTLVVFDINQKQSRVSTFFPGWKILAFSQDGIIGCFESLLLFCRGEVITKMEMCVYILTGSYTETIYKPRKKR